MKTLLTRIKSTLQADSTLSGYVKAVEIHAPGLLPETSYTELPFIGVAPTDAPEEWVSTRRKDVRLAVELSLVYDLLIEETSVIGDDNNKGLVQFVEDVKDAIRGEFFSSGGIPYLSKPCDIIRTQYVMTAFGDNAYMFVATITLDCRKLIIDSG